MAVTGSYLSETLLFSLRIIRRRPAATISAFRYPDWWQTCKDAGQEAKQEENESRERRSLKFQGDTREDRRASGCGSSGGGLISMKMSSPSQRLPHRCHDTWGGGRRCSHRADCVHVCACTCWKYIAGLPPTSLFQCSHRLPLAETTSWLIILD